MKLLAIAVDKLKEKLSEPHTLDLLKEELLGIRLRQKIYLPENKEIKDDPVRRATTDLLAAQGKKPFWLLVGGLMESRLKLTTKITGVGGIPGNIGFSAEGLLDFYTLHPYAIDSMETPERILAEHTIDLPVNATKAESLLPGTTFQLMGKGVASLSGGLTYTKGIASVSLTKNEKVEGNYTIRLVREKGSIIKVVLAQTLERIGNIALTAKLGYSVDVGSILKHDAYKKAEAELDNLNLDKITGAIPGWPKDKSLTDYIKTEGVDKGIKKVEGFLKDYSDFYSTLGHKSTQKQRNLIAYRFDLSKAKAKIAFSDLLHLNEAKVATAADDANSGVKRYQFKEDSTIDESFFSLVFAGKKLVLASTLRSEREGFLSYDNNIQIMRNPLFSQAYDGMISGSKKITWESLDVELNGNRSPLGYWRVMFTNYDKFAGKSEILRFRKFAAQLGASTPEDDAKIAKSTFFKKLFGKDDDTKLALDIYFTEEGITTISTSTKNQVREICFSTASALGDIEEGAPWNNMKARHLMKGCIEYASDITGESESDIEYLQRKYKEQGWDRDLRKDAKVYQIVLILITNISQMNNSQEEKEKSWARIFKDIGQAARFRYMIIIATLASLAGRNETLLDNLELKRVKSGEILAMADEESDIMTADEFFVKAKEQISNAIV